jgi:hypothetical protein
LGGQAIAEAMAASDKSGVPFFWSEKDLDHGDKWELLIGAIRGTSKSVSMLILVSARVYRLWCNCCRYSCANHWC